MQPQVRSTQADHPIALGIALSPHVFLALVVPFLVIMNFVIMRR